MPPIDTERSTRVRPRRTRVRPAPRPRGTTRTFTPKGKPRSAAPAPRTAPARPVTPAPRPRGTTRVFTPQGKPRRPDAKKLPKSFKSERSQSQEFSKKDQDKITRIARRIGSADRIDRERAAKRKFFSDDPIKQIRGSQRNVLSAFSELRESDPEAYDRKVRESDDNVFKKVSKAVGRTAQKGIETVAEGAKKSLPDKVYVPTGRGTRSSEMSFGPTRLGREATDLIAQTPNSVYMVGAAVKEAADGNPTRAKKLVSDFNKTSAIAALAQGDLKEAGKRANERPLTTALEVSGVRALAGRGAGTATRSGVLGKTAKRYGSTQREPLRYYPGSRPGEGPAAARRYSKDLITNRLQKRADRKKVKRGEDPNVYRERTVPSPVGGRSRVGPNAGLTKRPLDELVDRHVHAKNVTQGQEVRRAERKAAKREKSERRATAAAPPRPPLEPLTPPPGYARREAPRSAADPAAPTPRPTPRPPRTANPAAAAAARERTVLNERVADLDPKALARQAHDVLGIEKPVVFKVMGPRQVAALTERLGKEPRGWTRPIRPTDDHYVVFINPKHPANQGPKGASNVAHYELGRVQAEQMGIHGPGATGSGASRAADPLTEYVRSLSPDDRITMADQAAAVLENFQRQATTNPNSKAYKDLKSRAEHAEKVLAAMADVRPGSGRPQGNAYFDNPNTKHAQEVMRAHIGTDLRVPPPELPPMRYEGSPRASRVDEAGQMAAMATQQTSMVGAVRQFGVRLGPKGHYKEWQAADKAAKNASERLGVKMVPVNVERLTRVPKEPVVPRASADRPITLATAEERAWREAVTNRSPGQWVAMPEDVVKRFIEHAENARKFGTPQKVTNQFKDVVLTTGNPVRWLGGNVTDLGMRTVFEGLTPLDLYRGGRLYGELGKYGRRGKMVRVSTMGGGFGHLARDVSHEVGRPATRLPGKAWDKWRQGIYGLESAIETIPQMATVGKEMRMGRSPNLRQGLKGLARATDDQVQAFAKEMVTDPAVELRVARHVEDVVGSWGKLSPEARRVLVAAPFAQWLGASTRYVLVTLPAKHPIKTGIMAAMNEMTEAERQKLGLSQFLPLEKQAQDYQMMTLPQSVTKDKYGPVVKGTDLARALSFGTVKDASEGNVGGFLFPQLSGAVAASIGSSWTGERLVYPDNHPKAGMELSAEDRRFAGMGMLAESFTPFASTFRRVFQEKGRPSLPQSTFLDPQTRLRYDKEKKEWVPREGSVGQGAKRLTGWPIPGLPIPRRVYTKGAVHRIESNKVAIREVKRWNEERTKPKHDFDFRGSRPEPKDDFDFGKKKKKTKARTVDPDWDFR